MPAFENTGFYVQNALLAGERPVYCWGSLNTLTAPTRAFVTNVALTSNVATVSLSLKEGQIPVVGQTISIQGTTSTSGLFNVSNATVTGVSGFSTGDNSTGTVTFALTHANVGTAADTGAAVLPIPEIGESLANGASKAFCVQSNGAQIQNGRTVKATVSFPSIASITAATVKLQDAMDIFDTFQDVYTLATVASGVLTTGGSVELELTIGRWYRFNTSGVSGSGTIVAKLFA